MSVSSQYVFQKVRDHHDQEEEKILTNEQGLGIMGCDLLRCLLVLRFQIRSMLALPSLGFFSIPQHLVGLSLFFLRRIRA